MKLKKGDFVYIGKFPEGQLGKVAGRQRGKYLIGILEHGPEFDAYKEIEAPEGEPITRLTKKHIQTLSEDYEKLELTQPYATYSGVSDTKVFFDNQKQGTREEPYQIRWGRMR